MSKRLIAMIKHEQDLSASINVHNYIKPYFCQFLGVKYQTRAMVKALNIAVATFLLRETVRLLSGSQSMTLWIIQHP